MSSNPEQTPPGGARTPEHATLEDLAAIVEELHEFWGERARALLHHPLLVHELGDTAFVIRDGDRRVLAYLFGLVTPRGVGYIHLVAVRDGHRREGCARALYERFEAAARALGAHSLKAFTQPENTTSIAFHRSRGFTATETPDYAGPGQARVVFTRELQRQREL